MQTNKINKIVKQNIKDMLEDSHKRMLAEINNMFSHEEFKSRVAELYEAQAPLVISKLILKVLLDNQSFQYSGHRTKFEKEAKQFTKEFERLRIYYGQRKPNNND